MHTPFFNRNQIFLLNPIRKNSELKLYQFSNILSNPNQEPQSKRIKDKGLKTHEMCRSLIFNFSSQDDKFMIVK